MTPKSPDQSLSITEAAHIGDTVETHIIMMGQEIKDYKQQLRSALRREERLRFELEKTAIEAAAMLAKSVDEKDEYTAGHCERLSGYAVALGRELGVPRNRIKQLRYAALLHDVGKVGVPEAILLKPAKLTDDEWVIMKTHPSIGADLVRSIYPLKPAAEIVAQHHERWDGKGYPKGMKGEAILIEARILSVVDAYDAMTTDRPYRKALSDEEAYEELQSCSGSAWDPEVVDAFMRCFLDVH